MKINVNDVELFCSQVGDGDPVIVVHGGPGLDHSYLSKPLAFLSEEFSVLMYDQRASGKSSGFVSKESLSLDSFVDDLFELKKHFAFRKFTLIGHSWGGVIAMAYAAKYPETLDAMVLINTDPANAEGMEAFIKEVQERMRPIAEEAQGLIASAAFRKGEPAAIETYLKMIFGAYCFDPKIINDLDLQEIAEASTKVIEVSECVHNNILNTYDLFPRLGKITCPTLLIHGADEPIPTEHIQRIAEAIPHAELHVLDRCGHFAFIEAEAALRALVAEFLFPALQV